MQKREFEELYGSKISQERWLAVEQEYMNSDALDRFDFVRELKARKDKYTLYREKGEIEIRHNNFSRQQFLAHVIKCLRDTPFANKIHYFDLTFDHGPIVKDGSNGYHEYFLRKDGNTKHIIFYGNGIREEFIFEYRNGVGRCYIRNDLLKPRKAKKAA